MILPSWFWAWAKWLDNGKRGPRPATAPKRIPAWAWARYALHRGHKPPVDIPTPDPPNWWRSPFESKGVLTSYGMVNGDLRAPRVCDLAKQHGYRYVAGQFYPENEPFLQGLRDECSLRGLRFGIWDATPTVERLTRILTYQPHLVILESEGAATDWEAIAAVMGSQRASAWAVVTNLSGLDDQALQQGDWSPALLTECYEQDNPNTTPARMEAEARARGYKVVVPCVGVHHAYALQNYLPLESFCVYTAEYMSDTDWAAA